MTTDLLKNCIACKSKVFQVLDVDSKLNNFNCFDKSPRDVIKSFE